MDDLERSQADIAKANTEISATLSEQMAMAAEIHAEKKLNDLLRGATDAATIAIGATKSIESVMQDDEEDYDEAVLQTAIELRNTALNLAVELLADYRDRRDSLKNAGKNVIEDATAAELPAEQADTNEA